MSEDRLCVYLRFPPSRRTGQSEAAGRDGVGGSAEHLEDQGEALGRGCGMSSTESGRSEVREGYRGLRHLRNQVSGNK